MERGQERSSQIITSGHAIDRSAPAAMLVGSMPFQAIGGGGKPNLPPSPPNSPYILRNKMRTRTGVLYMRNYGLFSVVNRMNELVTTGNQFSQNAVAPAVSSEVMKRSSSYYFNDRFNDMFHIKTYICYKCVQCKVHHYVLGLRIIIYIINSLVKPKTQSNLED